jgi:hypothetical protein
MKRILMMNLLYPAIQYPITDGNPAIIQFHYHFENKKYPSDLYQAEER